MSTQFKSQKLATVFGLTTVLCWSTVATAFKLSLEHLNPVQLILIASCASWCFLLLVLVFQGRLNLHVINKRGLLSSFLFGCMNPLFYYFLLFSAYSYLPAQEAQSLNYSWAIVMSLLAVPLLKQRLSRFDIFAALKCYLGVLTIATQGDLLSLNFTSIKGVLFALASTVVWSLYWILNQRDSREPVVALFMNFSVALPLIFLYALFTGDAQELATKPWQAYVGGVYIGIFEMGLAFILWLKAMKLAENTAKIANLIFISPFLSLIFISVILDEHILKSTLIGLSLIISGLILQQRFAPREYSDEV